MKKKINIGTENFKRCIEENYYYIDKTLLIKDILDRHDTVNLITRPRRFGKTLNLSMIQHFFEIGTNANLFDGLLISREDTRYMAHCGSYPVISLSFKGSKMNTYDLTLDNIFKAIRKEFIRHQEAVAAYQTERFQINSILDGSNAISDYNDSLFLLSQILKTYYGKRVIILLDEYDVPLEHSYFSGFYQDTLAFIRSLFESALKTNDNLEFAILTGCLRVSKESIFTGLNNLAAYSILNYEYSRFFGFTEQEVIELANYFSYTLPPLKDWYNGYQFGNTKIYNPWSVLQAVKTSQTNKDFSPIAYWANTSSNSIIRTFVETADSTAKNDIESLIEGNVVIKKINEYSTYADIETSAENLWNFLYYTGYLTLRKSWVDDTGDIYAELMIPNKEVLYIFRTKIIQWFADNLTADKLKRFYHVLLDNDQELIQEEINQILITSIGYDDFKETFYHGLLLGMLTGLNDYIVKSNRETGHGRSDISIKYANSQGPAMIFEFKIAENINDLDKKCLEALNQIETKAYDQELKSEGYKDIRKIGIAFHKKICKAIVAKQTAT